MQEVGGRFAALQHPSATASASATLYDTRAAIFLTDEGGVLDFHEGDHRPLYPGCRMTKRELTHEIGDHLPLWIPIDTSGDQLDQALGRGTVR